MTLVLVVLIVIELSLIWFAVGAFLKAPVAGVSPAWPLIAALWIFLALMGDLGQVLA